MHDALLPKFKYFLIYFLIGTSLKKPGNGLKSQEKLYKLHILKKIRWRHTLYFYGSMLL